MSSFLFMYPMNIYFISFCILMFCQAHYMMCKSKDHTIINLSFSFLLLLMLLSNSGLLKGIPKADLEFELLPVSRDKAFGSFFFPLYCNVVLNQGHEMLVQYKQPWY